MKIHRLIPGGEQKLHELTVLYRCVFGVESDLKYDAAYYKTLLQNDNFVYLVSEENHEVNGGLTAYMLPSVHGYIEIYLYDIAVSPKSQKMGVGTALMNRLFEISKQTGAREVFVQANNVDEHALKFYKKLGGEPEEDITHFSFRIA